jgi:hypothetical protein
MYVAAAVLLLALAATACRGGAPSATRRPLLRCRSTARPSRSNPSEFTTQIDNAYWPMKPGGGVPYGRFEHGVQTRNFSGIEPDVIEEKIDAQGVGVVLEITVSGGSDREELLNYHEG